jgi:hypothetical protein
VQQASQSQLAKLTGPIDAMTVLGWVVGGLSTVFTIAIGGGAMASAARGLVVDVDAIAETFA